MLTEDLRAGSLMHGVQTLNPLTDTNPGSLASRLLEKE